MRLRLLKTLGGPGKRFLHDSRQLKYILCPVVAKSAAEQQKFYELFDRFHKDVLSEDLEIMEEKEVPFWDRMPKWLMWLLITFPVVVLIGYGLYKVLVVPEPAEQGIYAEASTAAIGDTVLFRNLAPQEDTLTKNFYWSLVDDLTGETALEDSASFHWQFEVPQPGKNYRKTVKLIYEDKETMHRDTFSNPLLVQCAGGPPVISTPGIPPDGEKGKAIQFSITVPGQDTLLATWNFDDDTPPVEGFTVEHSFVSNGNYEIEVRVVNENAAGFCETVLRDQISIGQEKAFLALKTLEKDKLEPSASFSWATWILMSLLAIAIVYYWVRWFARKAPEEEKQDKSSDSRPDHFRSSDKGPYLIPYRSQDAYIQVGLQLFRFADTMRSRQEGLRSSLDIPGSVKATIEGGGFPQLLEKKDTQPTEYLFLIDEQSMESHQARLFEYLITFLRGKDVLLETFYYNTDFNRFWNKYHPKGINDVMLPRMFQHHRLVVMGDAHGLLDPLGNGGQQLREKTSKVLKAWKERLLITPLPPESWTWKEAALHRLFPVFPADILGLGQAMKYIESGRAQDEHQPNFETWKKGLLADRAEADVNRRRWHRLKEYQSFLKDHPDVYKWLCALAVCPQPRWETTIAIGKALKPVGVEVTFDKLLLLARIPFLQSGILPGSLRIELLRELDDETERLAREVVREELEAIRARVKDSHANFELNSQLAVQRFALSPGDDSHKADIRYLLDNGLLDKRQVEELEKSVQRHAMSAPEEDYAQSSMMSKMAPNIPTLDQFLEEREEPPESPQRPFVTPDFIKAISATVLFIVLFLFIWNLDGTDRLYQMAFGSEKTMKVVGDDGELENLYHFVQEILDSDSAAIYNNASVTLYENDLLGEIDKEIRGDSSKLREVLEAVKSGFDHALEYDPDYELARTNKGKLWFNVGATLYNDMLEKNDFTEAMADRLHNYFQEGIASDSVKLDALHANGLLHFYEEKMDSAKVHYGQILNDSDSLFFDTLSTYPHLEYLLFKDSEEVPATVDPRIKAPKEEKLNIKVLTFNRMTKEPLSGATVRVYERPSRGREKLTDSQSNVTGNEFSLILVKGKTYRIVANKQGYSPDEHVFDVRKASDIEFYLGPQIGDPLVLPLAVYFDDEKPTDAGKGQPFAYFEKVISDYYKRKPVYIAEVTLGLNGKEKTLKESEVSAFFDREVNGAKGTLNYAFNNWLEMLKGGDRIKISLRGYDDPKGPAAESERIAERRVDFVINMVSAFQGGVLLPYINSGQLNFVQNPFGENKAPRDISDNINDPRNSVYAINAAKERRVEIILDLQPEETPPPQTQNPLHQALSLIIADKLTVDRKVVVPSASFAKELGANDAEMLALKLEVEKQYSVSIDEKAALGMVTVQDFYDLVQTAISATPPPKDSDKDGVADNKDICPNTRQGDTVDENGCSTNDYAALKKQDFPKENAQAPPPFREPEMIRVPGGTFQMGCKEEKGDQWNCPQDAQPLHEVTLDAFSIGKYEVTQELWESVMGNNPSEFQNCPKCPVEKVSWDDVQDFIDKLNKRTGKKYRLPTEAEWEYAAKGGNKGGSQYLYAGSNDLDAVGWYFGNSGSKTHPVGGKMANALGVYDMSGNVREWCSDWYAEDYYKSSPKRNPKGPRKETVRVFRGGSWYDGAVHCRVSNRDYWHAYNRNYNLGFRLAHSSK